MKKIALIILVICAFGLGSCKKCTTCQVTNHSTFTSYPEEKCGSESDVSDFEKEYEKKAQDLSSIYIGVVADCKRKN
jgi:hypothetical protein